MEFKPDVGNPARNLAFLQKTKNQAKNLFKMAKNNSLNLSISNLSQAQEILAQINGFPDWHALEATITRTSEKKSTVLLPEISEFRPHTIFNLPIVEDGIPAWEHQGKVVSFLSIDELPTNSQSAFLSFMDDVINQAAFTFNMGFYQINLMLNNSLNHYVKDTSDYPMFTYSSKWGISKEVFDRLFTVNLSSKPQMPDTKTSLHAILVIATDIDMREEHGALCNTVLRTGDTDFFSFSARSYLTTEEQNIYLSGTRAENDSDLSLQHLFGADIQHAKWAYALYLLSEKNYVWDMNVDINHGSIKNFLIRQGNKTVPGTELPYIKGLIKSLTYDNPTKGTHRLVGSKKASDNKYPMFPYPKVNKGSLPWTNGIPLTNVSDNMVSYFQPNSLLQNTSTTLIFAKPGSGKSMLMNTLAAATCFSPEFKELPHIGIIDIGPSSWGLIKMLQNILPREKQYLVQYHRMQMTEEFCVNPFDTQLGCRMPSPEERQFLCNFLLLLLTDPNKEKPEDVMTGLVQAIIDQMYMSILKHPKRYDFGTNIHVDAAVGRHNIKTEMHTTWWEIVDQLFLMGDIYAATLAQRHAVPLLNEAGYAAQSDTIRDIYGQVTVATGETLIQYFNRAITGALINYKILTRPTVFDIGEAKVVAIDLDDLAKSGGVMADKQTAVMYMLARYILGKNYKVDSETINQSLYGFENNIPLEKYKHYHQAIIASHGITPKTLWFDEFHRTSKSQMVRDQLVVDMREGRKFNISVTIASQSISDFDETITSFATSTFIMDGGHGKDIERIFDTFGILDPTEQSYFKQGKIHGPRSGHPGVFYAKFLTSYGRHAKLLSLNLNPALLNALSSDQHTMSLIREVAKSLPYLETLELVTKYFPKGARAYVEQRIEEENIFPHNIEKVETYIKEIAKELLSKIKYIF